MELAGLEVEIDPVETERPPGAPAARSTESWPARAPTRLAFLQCARGARGSTTT